MKKLMLLLVVTGAIAAMHGCASLGGDPAERILGQWQTRIGGFPVTVEYTQSTVRVAGNKAVAYKLDGDRLILDQGGSQTRIVSFPSRGEMIQTDPITGTEHRYVKVETQAKAES